MLTKVQCRIHPMSILEIKKTDMGKHEQQQHLICIYISWLALKTIPLQEGL